MAITITVTPDNTITIASDTASSSDLPAVLAALLPPGAPVNVQNLHQNIDLRGGNTAALTTPLVNPARPAESPKAEPDSTDRLVITYARSLAGLDPDHPLLAGLLPERDLLVERLRLASEGLKRARAMASDERARTENKASPAAS
jgi:hypothetical protein